MAQVEDFLRKHNLSQVQLAEILQVDQKTVRRWLSGQRQPLAIVSVALKMADKLIAEHGIESIF